MSYRHLSATTLLAITALLFSGCARTSDENISTEIIRPAKLLRVSVAHSDRRLNFPAIIESAQSSQLTFPVSGQVVDLNILEGQSVSKGEILGTLEDRSYQNTVTQAQVEYENAETEYQRAKRLYDQDAISRSVLEQRDAARKVSKASLDSAQKSRGDTDLRAPFDGVVSRVLVEQFQNVQPGEPIVVVQSDKVQAVVNMPAGLVALSKKLNSRKAHVELDAAPGYPIAAEFREASGLADNTTQTFQVGFSFLPPDQLVVLPGMTATVYIDIDLEGANGILGTGIAVPLSAVMTESGRKFVWKVDPNTMKISKHFISTGQGVDGDLIIVSQGLSNGDLIVSAGGAFLSEDTQVSAWTQ